MTAPEEGTAGPGVPDLDRPARDRLTRWRLVLGGQEADGITAAGTRPGSAGTGGGGADERAGAGDLGEPGAGVELTPEDRTRDEALRQLYETRRGGGLGGSAPRVARWLGDIRRYFPSPVVRVMQADAMERLGLRQLLLEPEMMHQVQPDIGLVTTLVGLGSVIPERSRATARAVVRQVTEQLEERLAARTVQTVTGALHRASRTRRPRHADIDWGRTVLANLRHYQPEHGTVIPERLVGYGRRSRRLDRHVILCLDQSGSMAESVVFGSVFGAVLASLRSLRTSLVVFDTEVADLTDRVEDPVEVLFGVQLGGGTDIDRALAYCQGLVERPEETILVLLTDLYEGGDAEQMLRRAGALARAGVTVVTLLALSDSGAPSYDAEHAAALAALGIPAFACTPELFPDLMAAAIEGGDLAQWAAGQGMVTSHAPD